MSSARSTRAKPPPVSGHSHGKPRSICPIARSPPKSPPTPSDLTHVSAIIHVERAVYTRQAATGLWKFSRETSFYLSNRPLAAEIAADAIRKHWGIENTSHHTRDVTFREDASRIRKNPGIFARIRTIAYNVLRCNKSDTTPQDRFGAALGGLEAMFEMTFSRER